MGNVPISCCRSKSPRPDSDARYGGENNANYSGSRKLSHSAKQKHGLEDSAIMQQSSQNTLQHISEREPDDSDTDPSSNALNRPIFAQRSSSSKNQQCKLAGAYDSYSSNNSASMIRKSTLTPLTSSQDQGYNSSASTNLTHYDGSGGGGGGSGGGGPLTNSSFVSTSIHANQQQNQTGISEQIDGLKVSAITSQGGGENAAAVGNDGCQFVPSYSRRFYLSSGSRRHQDDDDQLPINCEDRMKASSCSTIFIDNSTISQPDLDQTIKCVSLAIYYHIRNRTSEEVAEIFDESIHPLRMPSYPFELTMNNQQQQQKTQSFQQSPPVTNQTTEELIILDNNDETTINSQNNKRIEEPDQETIYQFVKTLFKAAQLTSEYAITTLVYLERLMTYAEMDLTPRSWRRMFLGAILLSSKVWEDQAIWNVDYAQILEEISVDDINELERQFLELIQFNMNVPSSVYAKYYFHLRTLALKNNLTEEQTLMTTGRAKDLEAMSKVHTTDDWFSSPIHRKSPPPIKKHTSLERLRSMGFARAVLM